MVEHDDKKEEDHKCKCPVNEWARHALYIGGMVALHAGMGASATVANKHEKCPASEWGRHLLYVGGAVVLAVKGHACCNAIANGDAKCDAGETECEKNESKCPVNEWWKRAVYIGVLTGAVALINSRKSK